MAQNNNTKDFQAVQLVIASPDQIRSWSFGEITKPETMNYRTLRAELDGLFCPRIFGPEKSYECYCGKYKKIRYKGVVCDKCGVLVAHRSVRRERMGHIKLAADVVHIWYLNAVPSKISLLLDIQQKKLQSVVYFSRYLITDVNDEEKNISMKKIDDIYKENLEELATEVDKKIEEIKTSEEEKIKELGDINNDKQGMERDRITHAAALEVARVRESMAQSKGELDLEIERLRTLVQKIRVSEVLSEEEMLNLEETGLDGFFTAMMGASAVKEMLHKVDMKKLYDILLEESHSKSMQKRLKALQRLRIVGGFMKNNTKPEWLVMDTIPVIPPELRPIVQLQGGKFATTDMNDLYRRVINRNNRLKSLVNRGAPEVILRNEKRMLQEAVDALIDNSHRPSPPVVSNRRIPLKSLSDSLRGKSGRFRQNLLGKRVDYSGRAVIITAGADIRLDQCGLPKKMALELFKPFVIKELVERGIATNIRNAKNMLTTDVPDMVWDILADIIKEHPVMLNRPPTMHKQSIQAYYPVLIDGDAIAIHPMVCAGFNADFDGDQMAVHVPISQEAIQEARDLMMTKNNILNAEHGKIIIGPDRELIHGIYYMTVVTNRSKTIDTIFSDPNEAILAYSSQQIKLQDNIKVFVNDEVVETTVGRLIFNEILPTDYPFVNNTLSKKEISALFGDIFKRYGPVETVDVLNKVTKLSFTYATKSGFSVGLDDIVEAPNKGEIIENALKKTLELDQYYQMGVMSSKEKVKKFIEIWKDYAMKEILKSTLEVMDDNNPIKMVIKSGARWTNEQILQVAGIKGIVMDPNNKVVEYPITSNFSHGLNPMEYFVSARGARKGLVDTALRTAEAGYLTRKLINVAQDSIIREHDCGTERGMLLKRADDEKRGYTYLQRITGRWVSKAVIGKGGEIIVEKGEEITPELAKIIETQEIDNIEVRSSIGCETKYGLCQKCYGYDLGTGTTVQMGKAVGIVAAQSCGEPTTQLTLRTFHSGGIASADITSTGIPRLNELFEARVPSGAAIISEIDGMITISESKKKNMIIITVSNMSKDNLDFEIAEGDVLAVTTKDKEVKLGQLLMTKADGEKIVSPRPGVIKITAEKIILQSKIKEEVKYELMKDEELLVVDGEKVEAGQFITHGNINPKVLVETKGLIEAQNYMINEILGAYNQQGVQLSEKHIEIIVSSMSKYVRITAPGDSTFLPGEFRDLSTVEIINKELVADGLEPAKFSRQIMGVTQASLKTESFLSAASFQEQVRVLSDAAVLGKIDYLRGLKENVMIGRLIPVGDRAAEVVLPNRKTV
ncbi:MAG: DNA-directed RNA polymerase subunit beta' [bacterium]